MSGIAPLLALGEKLPGVERGQWFQRLGLNLAFCGREDCAIPPALQMPDG